MPTRCPDCHVDLVWIEVLTSKDGHVHSGIPYAEVDARAGAVAASALPVAGVIHGGRCPRCRRVLLFAFPQAEVGRPTSAAEAAQHMEQWDAEQRAKAAAASRPQSADDLALELLTLPARSSQRPLVLAKLVARADPEDVVAHLERALALRAAADRASEQELLSSTTSVLIELGTKAALGAMRRLLDRAAWRDRLRIFQAFERDGSDVARAAVLEGLIVALNQGLPTVAGAAVGVLERMGGAPNLEPVLLRCLDSPSDALVAAAIHALGELGSEAAGASIHEAAHGLFRAGAIKDAAAWAVERLRARYHAPPEGALTVSEGVGGGGLTLADADADTAAGAPPGGPGGPEDDPS